MLSANGTRLIIEYVVLKLLQLTYFMQVLTCTRFSSNWLRYVTTDKKQGAPLLAKICHRMGTLEPIHQLRQNFGAKDRLHYKRKRSSCHYHIKTPPKLKQHSSSAKVNQVASIRWLTRSATLLQHIRTASGNLSRITRAQLSAQYIKHKM